MTIIAKRASVGVLLAALSMAQADAKGHPIGAVDLRPSSMPTSCAGYGQGAQPTRSIFGVILAITGARWLCAIPVSTANCLEEIELLEKRLARARTNPADQPTADQTVGTQLGHQPTPKSVELADEKAIENVQGILNRARTLDAEHKTNECRRAVADAKAYFPPD